MTYTVKYKKKFDIFWSKIKKVKGDLIINEYNYPVRVLILEDETRIEIPLFETIFQFSKERFIVIKQNMEKESGQKLNVD